jgi:CTP synthase (UTP-ammonia lyase)
MARPLTIGLVGDYDSSVIAHQAIPRAIDLAAGVTNREVRPKWIPTETITSAKNLQGLDGLWCVPASPYRSTEGALTAIRYAREAPKPFLGTCGGFQHALIEYARNVAGLDNADHAESNPDAELKLVAPLACSLVEQPGEIRLEAGSFVRAICGCETLTETYHCRYGLNPAFRQTVERDGLRFVGFDAHRRAETGQPPFIQQHSSMLWM